MARQPKPTATETAARVSKIDILVDLLSQPEGADLPTLVAATGWQAHSVRGALSGTLKARRGLAIASERTPAGRIYRIVQG
ncbi:MAG: DUF3489 domain-containing protein [Phenylobacterium sp.]|jgi:hypothetical protein|uniref:DUF3489 domain-containing protein n=1 Tax=Phenylobacterium sp. TaxID=1871053 RepID=UPI0025D968FC|nr:DUF3489 domain-containing protein [Phenylobacterium sp.]MCA6299157.1 DUF3489 domain-containing protein [Phenylobacterium sp.]